MIICAALLLENKEQKEVILPCQRHGIGYEMIRKLHIDAKVLKEGFINHEGVFFDRCDALAHAIECGQLTQANRWYKEDNHESELYSEDLY